MLGLSLQALGVGLNTGAFDPSQIAFTSGLWLDPSILGTGYQDRSGTTPQTASAQPTGLRLDRSLSLAAAAPFASGPDNTYTYQANVALAGSTAVFTGASGNNGFFKSPGASVAAGNFFEITYTIDSISAGTISAYIGGTASALKRTTPGTYTERIGTAGTDGLVAIRSDSAIATTAVVSNVSWALVQGNHVSQSSGTVRPEYDLISGIASDFRDGVDDVYGRSFSAGTLTANMDAFLAIKRAGATDGQCAFITAATSNFGIWETSASRPDVNAGTPSYLVNGGAIAATRTALKAAMTVGQYVVVEIQGLDLSTWTSINFGFTAGYPDSSDLGGVILCPAQSAANRALLRRWLGAKVGLTL